MKIAILTQPLNANYGGVLQNWALQFVLRQLGHEPVTIDYIHRYNRFDWLKASIKNSGALSISQIQTPLFTFSAMEAYKQSNRTIHS